MPTESSGGFIAPGVLRPVQLTHAEVSRKGGQARSEAKRRASLANLEKAKARREAPRGARFAAVA